MQKEDNIYTQSLVVPNPQGLHARPANVLAKLVKKIGQNVFIENAEGKQANAKKMLEVLGLGLEKGSKISIISDSQEAVNAVLEAFEGGLGDDLSEGVSANRASENKEDINAWQPEGDIEHLKGIAASDGLVIGKIFHYRQQHFDLPEQVGTVAEETALLHQAISQAKERIMTMKSDANSDQKAIFEAHLSIVEEADIVADTLALIEKGHNAARAYKKVSDDRIESLANIANIDIAARATDIRDVRNHVINALLGKEEKQHHFEEAVILCAHDLTPSDTVKLNPAKTLAFITAVGGPASHSAIIARGMGMPAVVAAGDKIREIAENSTLIVDGSSGNIYVNPSQAQLASAQSAIIKQQEQREKDNKRRLEKGQTADGFLIDIAANVNAAKAVKAAVDAGAESVGLMRTEFLYMERESIPDEVVQEKAYRDMAASLEGAPLIIRTLDIGGDKEVPYLGLAHEDNAFLGVRGIRLCLERPDLFTPQLRAICRVAKDYPNVRVMFPMIGKLSDWQKAISQLESIRNEVGAPKFPVGMMIEIPSAALIASVLADYVDFFSIGTNDLTQYTLAMDRMHPLLAAQADAMHPAVLQLIKMTVDAAQKKGKWVGVCGGAAGDSDAAKVLVGLGVTELSMAPPQIAGVKAVLRQHTQKQLQDLAQNALALDGSTAVRALLKNSR